MPYFDTHCHLDFAQGDWADLHSARTATQDKAPQDGTREHEGPARKAHAAADRFVCTTCTPQDFLAAEKRFGGREEIIVGCGLHPRWIADGACSTAHVDQLCDLVPGHRVIGEVGLDFLRPYAHAAQEQTAAFRRIMQCCANVGDRVVSIHALRSATQVLDILQETGAARNCCCIMHWFSGSSQELHRAIQAGCWFSVNNRMLATGKGREYAKVIPASRLLLETDLPSQPGEQATAAQLHASLRSTLQALQELRRQDCAELCYQNARNLFEPAR